MFQVLGPPIATDEEAAKLETNRTGVLDAGQPHGVGDLRVGHPPGGVVDDDDVEVTTHEKP